MRIIAVRIMLFVADILHIIGKMVMLNERLFRRNMRCLWCFSGFHGRHFTVGTAVGIVVVLRGDFTACFQHMCRNGHSACLGIQGNTACR